MLGMIGTFTQKCRPIASPVPSLPDSRETFSAHLIHPSPINHHHKKGAPQSARPSNKTSETGKKPPPPSFADAKLIEKLIKNILNINPPGQPAERKGRPAQILSPQLAVVHIPILKLN